MRLSSLALFTSKNAKLPKVMSMTNSWILLLTNIFFIKVNFHTHWKKMVDPRAGAGKVQNKPRITCGRNYSKSDEVI